MKSSISSSKLIILALLLASTLTQEILPEQKMAIGNSTLFRVKKFNLDNYTMEEWEGSDRKFMESDFYTMRIFPNGAYVNTQLNLRKLPKCFIQWIITKLNFWLTIIV